MQRSAALSRICFVLFTGAVCVWVMSLPLFPTQDGPLHRYYTHALGSVLAHDPHYGVYAIRRPFPPYATQYLSLLALFHVFSFDLAEKLFTCAEILCFACGLRYAATAIGPAGAWVSLLAVPLLLPWFLMMGFYNYSLGLGLALLALGFWLRLERGPLYAVGFGAACVLVSASHPMPLGLLLVLLLADLARRGLPGRADAPERRSFLLRFDRRRVLGFAFLLILSIFPSLALDRSQNASAAHDLGLHLPFVRTVLLLTGLSPYNSRSHDLWINGYRAAAYALLLLTLSLGYRAFRQGLGARRPTLGAAFFAGALVSIVLLPFLPDHVNGGVYFATRAVIVVWIFAMLAASGADVGRKLPPFTVALGLVFTALTLVPAERNFRPLAAAVRHVEAQALPSHGRAFFLSGPMLGLTLRARYDIAFNPFLWANTLPVVEHDNLVLDAPWLKLASFPLHPAPGAVVVHDAFPLVEGITHDPTPRAAAVLPDERIDEMIRRSDIVTYAGTPEELRFGLRNFLGADEAARFRCTQAEAWSLLCVRERGEP